MANTPFFVRHGLNVNNQMSVLATDGSVSIGNTTSNASITNTSIVVGNTTINAFANSVSLGFNGTAIVNSSSLAFGNSTVNSIVNSTSISFNGSPGSASQYLQSNGTTQSWQTVAGGSDALVYLATMTASTSLALTNNTVFSNTYDDYMFVLSDLKAYSSETNTCVLTLRLYTDNDPSAPNGNEYLGPNDEMAANSYFYDRMILGSGSFIPGTEPGSKLSGVLFMTAINTTTATNAVKYVHGFVHTTQFGSNTSLDAGPVCGGYKGANNSRVVGVEFKFRNYYTDADSYIDSGYIKIYGIAKS